MMLFQIGGVPGSRDDGRMARRKHPAMLDPLNCASNCDIGLADTARPPAGLEHLYSSHMHTHHTTAEVEALEVSVSPMSP